MSIKIKNVPVCTMKNSELVALVKQTSVKKNSIKASNELKKRGVDVASLLTETK